MLLPCFEPHKQKMAMIYTFCLASFGVSAFVSLHAQDSLFTRVTGINVVTDRGNSVGSCWADFDNGGGLDLFVANATEENNFLYLSDGEGAFAGIDNGEIVNDGGNSFSGASCGDYDNDGDLDLFVPNRNGENNFLYQNNGGATFLRITTGDIANDGGNSRSGSWGDYDNDGFLDLFVTNVTPENNFLYHNNGDGSFTKDTTSAVANDGRNSRTGSWVDYDNDGDLDLFLVNYQQNNILYQNDGSGAFVKIGGADFVPEQGWSLSASWGDYDNDQDLDLFIANGNGRNNFLYENNGDGTFKRITESDVATDGGNSWDGSWGDVDNDGDLDLFVANGGGENNFLYLNAGDGNLRKMTVGNVMNQGGTSRSCSFGDYNRDGNLDLFVSNFTKNINSFLYKNVGNNHHWLNVLCVGIISNKAAIGSKVRVNATVDGISTWQLNEISGQTGYGSQNSLNAEFGLGDATVVDSIVIEWPSGVVQILADVAADQFLVIEEKDMQAPQILSVNAVATIEFNTTISVSASVSDDFAIQEVRLLYREGGQSAFQSIVMTEDNSVYSGAIPALVVNTGGVEFFVQAIDRFDNLSQSDLQPVRVHVENLIKTTAQPSGDLQKSYRLFSVPLDLDDKNPSAVFEDDLGPYNDTRWRFAELSSDQTYVEIPNTSAMRPGSAFWLLVGESGKRIGAGAGLSVATNQAFTISLHPGWNFVGSPFNFIIPTDKLSLQSGNPVELRSYAGTWSQPDASPVSSIVPFEGYAIFNSLSSSDKLIVDPDLSVSSNKQQVLFWRGQEEWSIRILARCRRARDEDNVALIITDASSGFDRWDRAEPPLVGEHVSVSFPHRDWQPLTSGYCIDARSTPEMGEIWEFTVATNIRDKVHLTFAGLDKVPAEFEIWLIDEALQLSQDLRKQNHFTLAAATSKHPKPLKLLVGRSDFISQSLTEVDIVPSTFELYQNFPNPFNPTTTIRYGLPREDRVTLSIYNLLGQEIVTLTKNELKAAGHHVAIWGGRDQNARAVPSGLYVYRLQIGTFVSIKKMALIK